MKAPAIAVLRRLVTDIIGQQGLALEILMVDFPVSVKLMISLAPISRAVLATALEMASLLECSLVS